MIIKKKRSVAMIAIGFGEDSIDRKNRRFVWDNTGTVVFEGDARIGTGGRIACRGELTFGDGCFVNLNTQIICTNKISFGSWCMIGWECLFMDTDFHSIYDCDGTLLNPQQPVQVGDHVWVGCRCTVLKGSVIPSDSVVAACSVVTKKLSADHTVYVGNKPVRENIEWKR